MLATLDMIATTEWVAILPGVMMARDRVQTRHAVQRLADPALSLDLVTIEAARRPLAAAAAAFRDLLQQTTAAACAVWQR